MNPVGICVLVTTIVVVVIYCWHLINKTMSDLYKDDKR